MNYELCVGELLSFSEQDGMMVAWIANKGVLAR
jgi:hypothetical protein